MSHNCRSMNATTKSVAIIGAGPAGLTAAYQLASKGVKVTVFEAGASVGGMSRTISLWGHKVDLGPHRFFSGDPRVNKLWLDLVGDRYSMVKRLTRIFYQGRFFDYPLKPFNALSGLGLLEAARCVSSYVIVRWRPVPVEDTFEDWVTNRFGRRLFEIFFRSYSEKLWGISCRALDADFAAQRIRKLSFVEAVKSALSPSGASRHRTLADEFAYPHDGAGAVYQEMAQRIRALGGEIRLRTPVASVHPAREGEQKARLILADGEDLAFDHIVSTMPITHLIDRIGAPDEVRDGAARLKFRNTILVYLRVAGASAFPDQWIYIHSPGLLTGRITNFRNWRPAAQGADEAVLCLEYWCYDGDEIWTRDEDALVRLASEELCRASLARREAIKDGQVVRVPNCYPVYEAGYRKRLAPVQAFLRQQRGLSVIGRYGAFKYNNQDHSILMGLLVAENIADGAAHDLWSINTDDDYQEASRISATGLRRG